MNQSAARFDTKLIDAEVLARLGNIALRGITLGSKFLLIFFLARFLDPRELGTYGLLVVTVGYSLYLLGFDFYTFTTREILKRERDDWGCVIKDQGALSVVLYLIVLPLLSLIFVQGLLPWPLAGWFFLILVLEHLTQELSRLLIAVSEQLAASVILFLRSGAWAVAVTALMFFRADLRNLDFVLAAWAFGGLAGLLVGAFKLHQMRVAGWGRKVDWAWIVKGLRVAVPFLLATLSIRALFTLDRYWFESLAGLQTLGAYVLFMGVSNAMMSFLDAGVFAFLYPKLISSHQQREAEAFRSTLKRLLIQTVGVSICFAAFATLALDPLLVWLDKPLYIEQQSLFPWILLGAFLYAVGMVPHYALYARGCDRPIIQSHIASLLVFMLATWIFSLQWPLLAVPLGLSTAFLIILLWKTWAFFYVTPSVIAMGTAEDSKSQSRK